MLDRAPDVTFHLFPIVLIDIQVLITLYLIRLHFFSVLIVRFGYMPRPTSRTTIRCLCRNFRTWRLH